MTHANLQQLELYDTLVIKNTNGETSKSKITRIVVLYSGIYTSEVDSIRIDQLKEGRATVEIDNSRLIKYEDIVQYAQQSSFLKIIFDKFKKMKIF